MNRVKIGWGKRELSIDAPVSIPGQMYMRVSEGIHDPLLTTALCVDLVGSFYYVRIHV